MNSRRTGFAPYVRAVSSTHPAPPNGLADALPATRRLLAAPSPSARPLSYGGSLPGLSPSWRSALRDELGLEVAYDENAVDPLSSRVFDVVYSRLRAEQVVLALSARTNLTLAGSTVRIVGDSSLATALTALLRRLGASVVRSTDDPVERLTATLDGVRVEDVAAATSGSTHSAILTGVGHDALGVDDVAGLVADASPRPVDASPAPSPRPFVRTTSKGSLVEMPSPLPVDGASPTSAQRRILDALIAALVVDGGPDDPRGVYARAVTP